MRPPDRIVGLLTLMDDNPQFAFIRVHRSYLINGMHIRKYSAKQLTLSNGEVIPVGGTQIKSVEEFLSQWLPDLA